MKKIIIILLLSSFISTVNGQITKQEYDYLATQIPPETTKLVINSPYLLVGEYLYYQAYTINQLNNGYSNISKILYVDLINANNERVFTHKLMVENNVAHANFFIPASLESGHYKLIAYTNWSKNNRQNQYDELDVFIINPFTSESQFKATAADSLNTHILQYSTNTPKTNAKDSKGLALKLEKNKFRGREKVHMNIAAMGSSTFSGNYVLSVRAVDSVLINKVNTNEQKNSAIPATFYLPELRGEIVSGKVKDSITGQAARNKIISLSIPGQGFVLKTSETNAKGEFYFAIDSNYDATNAFIQLQDSQADRYAIAIDSKAFNALENLEFFPLMLDKNIEDWLEMRNVQNQIENAYFDVKADSILKTNKYNPFYQNSGITYVLDDFTRFPSIQQTFIEVVNAARVTTVNDTIKFEVPDLEHLDFNRNFNYLDPLVLSDGLVITDNQDIIAHSAFKVETITVIPGIYIYGPEIYNGVISFVTKDRDFSLPNKSVDSKIDLVQPVSKKRYFNPDYSQAKNERIPDYRTQLLWEPNIQLESDETQFEFYTSDKKGLYQITVKGYSEKGDFLKDFIYFEVN